MRSSLEEEKNIFLITKGSIDRLQQRSQTKQEKGNADGTKGFDRRNMSRRVLDEKYTKNDARK
jgi:hypothetical protein